MSRKSEIGGENERPPYNVRGVASGPGSAPRRPRRSRPTPEIERTCLDIRTLSSPLPRPRPPTTNSAKHDRLPSPSSLGRLLLGEFTRRIEKLGGEDTGTLGRKIEFPVVGQGSVLAGTETFRRFFRESSSLSGFRFSFASFD